MFVYSIGCVCSSSRAWYGVGLTSSALVVRVSIKDYYSNDDVDDDDNDETMTTTPMMMLIEPLTMMMIVPITMMMTSTSQTTQCVYS